MTAPDKMYVIETSYFCAAVLVDTAGKIIHAAPILKWSLGRDISVVTEWAETKKAKVTICPVK